MAVGAAGADRDRRGPAEGGEGGPGAQPLGVVAGGQQQLGADHGAHALDREQARVRCGRPGADACGELLDLGGQVTVAAGQGPQRVEEVGVVGVGDLSGPAGGKGVQQPGRWQVPVVVADPGGGVDQEGADLPPRGLLGFQGGAAGHHQRPQRLDRG
ncbi:hypothetical protein, partial [Ornithinimicrobium cerasi]|uniref:hypothetical protein n=1 Tax=Ornithinimicrobium cerasi TaxID=2248773 RepID=UPI001FD3F2E1